MARLHRHRLDIPRVSIPEAGVVARVHRRLRTDLRWVSDIAEAAPLRAFHHPRKVCRNNFAAAVAAAAAAAAAAAEAGELVEAVEAEFFCLEARWVAVEMGVVPADVSVEEDQAVVEMGVAPVVEEAVVVVVEEEEEAAAEVGFYVEAR